MLETFQKVLFLFKDLLVLKEINRVIKSFWLSDKAYIRGYIFRLLFYSKILKKKKLTGRPDGPAGPGVAKPGGPASPNIPRAPANPESPKMPLGPCNPPIPIYKNNCNRINSTLC